MTEYHVIHVEASSVDEALELAEDNDHYYCDTDNASDTVIQIESVKEVVE